MTGGGESGGCGRSISGITDLAPSAQVALAGGLPTTFEHSEGKDSVEPVNLIARWLGRQAARLLETFTVAL